MLKQLLFVALVLVGFVPATQAQTLGLESKASASGTSAVADIYGEELNAKGDKGLFFWGLADTGKFGEIYLGPTWYPKKGIELQFGVGVENAPGFWRVGGAAYLSGKPGSLNLFWEDGASGYW